MDLLSLNYSTTQNPLPKLWHSLMLLVSSELPWILTRNLQFFSTLAQIPYSIFTIDAKDCTFLILLTLMYLLHMLTLNISLPYSKRRIYIFHRSKIEGADAARIIQCSIGFPSRFFFKSMLKVNQLQNFPITVSDINRNDAE